MHETDVENIQECEIFQRKCTISVPNSVTLGVDSIQSSVDNIRSGADNIQAQTLVQVTLTGQTTPAKADA